MQKKAKKVAEMTTLQLGKSGLSPGFLNEVKRQLEQKGIVKIKMLKSFVSQFDGDRKEAFKALLNSLGDVVVEDFRGKTVILKKPLSKK